MPDYESSNAPKILFRRSVGDVLNISQQRLHRSHSTGFRPLAKYFLSINILSERKIIYVSDISEQGVLNPQTFPLNITSLKEFLKTPKEGVKCTMISARNSTSTVDDQPGMQRCIYIVSFSFNLPRM